MPLKMSLAGKGSQRLPTSSSHPVSEDRAQMPLTQSPQSECQVWACSLGDPSPQAEVELTGWDGEESPPSPWAQYTSLQPSLGGWPSPYRHLFLLFLRHCPSFTAPASSLFLKIFFY